MLWPRHFWWVPTIYVFVQKNISTYWMKMRVIWSYVIYFQGRGSEIEPTKRETTGNISSFIAMPVAESTWNLPPRQTFSIHQVELNESTDIDVDQSIEDLVSQTISSSTEIHTIFFFFFLWKMTFDHSVSRCLSSAVRQHFHQNLCITSCSALKRE